VQAYIIKEAFINYVLLYRGPLTSIIKKIANPIEIEKQANPIKQTRPCINRLITRALVSSALYKPPRIDKDKN
jgi:hypothetical protein